MEPREIELRLAGTPAVLQRLARGPVLGRLATGRARIRRLRSVYFDTADLDLLRHGVSLRVRQDGRRYVQTAKSASRGPAGLSDRFEWEHVLTLPEPDLALLPRHPVLAEALAAARRAGLLPVFETEFRRREQRLRLPDGSEVAAALDLGEVRAGIARQPIAELELELKSGRPPALYELAFELIEAAPLRVQPLEKARRGYALATGGDPAQPQRSADLALPVDIDTGEAFRLIAGDCLSQVTLNAAAVLAGADSEGVHQMRVGLRRLRSAARLFDELLGGPDGESLVEEMRWLAAGLGPAREADVFVEELLAPVLAARPGDERFSEFARSAEAYRRRVDAEARAAVGSPRYTRFLLRAGRWLAEADWAGTAAAARPAADHARDKLERHWRKVRKLGDRLEALDDPGRHELRIRIKRLRYAGEFFRSLFPAKAGRSYLKRLAGLQDALGYLNDAASVQNLVAALAEAPAAARQRAARAWGGGLVLGWHLGGAAAALGKLPGRWKRLRRQPAFWR